MQITITKRIGLLLLLLSSGGVASLGAFYWFLGRIGTNDRYIEIAGRQRILTEEIHALADSLKLGQEGERSHLQNVIRTFDESLSTLEATVVRSEVSEEVLHLRQVWSEIRAPLVQFSGVGPPVNPEATQAYDRLEPKLPALSDASRRLAAAFEGRRRAYRMRLRDTLAGIAVLDLSVMLAGIWLTRRYVVGPIHLIEEGTRKFRAGDFGHRIPVVTRDELANLAHSSNEMATHIGELLAMVRSERERSKNILESITDGFFALDRQWRFNYVNPEAERLVFRSQKQLLGRNIWDAFPEAVGSTFQHMYQQVMDGRGTARFEAFYPPFDSWFEVHAYPSIDGISVYFRDITERKRGEERIRFQAALLDAVREAVIATDLKGVITHWNRFAESLFGLPASEALGRGLMETILARPVQPQAMQNLSSLLAGGNWSGELTLQAKGGQTIPVMVTGSPFFSDTGERRGMLSVCWDLTERKRMEAQVVMLQKMEAVGRLTGGVAHDFNNLLTVISGYGHMLRNQLDPNDPQAYGLDEILAAAGRAQALTNQLLAFSRRQIVQPSVINLNAIIVNLNTMLQRVIGEDIQLEAVLAPELGSVKADPNQIEQILMNLVLNARDAMPRGGKITIETANVELGPDYARAHAGIRAGSYVLLAVSDTGHGMDAETQKHLFEPFFTTKEQGKGTGLGLSTVYGIVKQGDGEVWVYSELGKGTTFKIYLPRVEKDAAKPRPVTAATPREKGWETILLIEDENALRALVRQMLQKQGYTVLEARNGQEAIRIGGQHPGPIHLLLTDVVLPGMSGGEAADLLAGSRPDLKVLYMSGYTNNAVVNYGPLDPGIAFLQKPFTPEALVSKVRAALAPAA